ncbi:MAG: DUF1788 domain-containing protein [Desulfobacterales bacterium]|nr:DUF1788 domain-containing protein [Desulfobacterales bacterium]MBL7102043.1 DUF1788 domain-containing protein [Desulfobacteraceae bacterium]MBL7173046.1 DUF1788 domain-containing protein [Desulfobacteraceae bacterium]
MQKDILPIQDRYDHLFKVISSERFLKMEGLGNDLPFFICPYPPEESLPMDRMRQQLTSRLGKRGIGILNIDLYDLSVDILKKRNIWEEILDIEKDTPKSELMELLQGVLDPKSHLVREICAIMAQTSFDVMFISGVGEVFPYIRSHNVLNNLQSTARDQPTVMFFPGVYTQTLEKGATLNLFGRLHDDKYYRAFNIFHREV